MAEVNEEFSRLFFEQCDFLVRTNVKYYVRQQGRVGGDSDLDLVICNLRPDREHPPTQFVLGLEDLRGIQCASVESKGWHEDRFTPSLINENPSIFNFVRKAAIDRASELLNTECFKKILLISALPLQQEAKDESIRLLKQRAVDHVIEFKTVVKKLWESIEDNKSYNSEILQTMRLVKKYL